MHIRLIRVQRFWVITGFLLCPSLYGEEAVVRGRVLDENNTPLPGARIALRSAAGATLSASSVTDGTFLVRAHPGPYTLSAECAGFFALRDRQVQLGAETLEIVLPRLQQTSEAVNVSASVAPVDSQDTTSERHVSGRQILDVPYPTTRDFRNALRIMPGVLQHPSGRLSFDGGGENQVLYTLNGFNVSDPVTGRFTMRMPVESVQSVSYASGRYSPEFGKGSAGALAIRTTNGSDNLRFSATNFVPGIETQKGLHIGTWSPRMNLSGPILKGRSWFSESVDTEYSVAVVPDRPRGEDRSMRWRGSSVLHGQVNVTPSQILSFDLAGGFEHLPHMGLSALDPMSTTINRGARQYFASLKDQLYFPRGFVADFGYAHTEVQGYERPQRTGMYRITPEGREGSHFANSKQHSRRDQVLANLFMPAFQAGGTHHVKAGIDLDAVHYSQVTLRTGFEIVDRTGRLLSRTTFGGPQSLLLRNVQMSSYVVDAWRVKPRLSLEYGVRQDWDELVRRVVLSPRFAAAVEPFANTRIAAGFGVIHDPSNIAMFARPLDQYSVTTAFDAGTPAGEYRTFYRATGRYFLPRFRKWSAGLEQRLGPSLRLSASALRSRGSRGFAYAAGTSDGFTSISELTNLRTDTYDSIGVTLNHTFGRDYGWMLNYTRSRALSNAVLDLSIDQPLQVLNNAGPLPWDSPHRLLSWGYVPGWGKNWAFAYLLDWRTGFPFSVVRDSGAIVGSVNSHRFPETFALNLHLERKFRLSRYRFALRAGLNNLTNSANASGVNNIIDSPNFLRYYGREGRHGVFRLRWLRQGE